MALNTTFGGVNPLVKEEQIPDYLKLSHPITQPSEDKTMGMILKGTGDLLKGGIDATTDLIKKHITDETYRRVDVEREGFTADLRNIAPGGGGIRSRRGGATTTGGETVEGGEELSYAPTTVPGDEAFTAFARAPGGEEGGAVITEEKADAPEGLSARIRYAEFLNNALKGGTISPTFYVGNINDIAKDLRAQYPGFRDHIDQEISRITGMNPANTMVNSLIRDINSHLSASGGTDKNLDAARRMIIKINEEGLDVLTEGKEGQPPTTSVMLDAIATGKLGPNPLPAVAKWAAEMRTLQGKTHVIDLTLKGIKGGTEIDKLNIMRAVNSEVPIEADKYMTSIYGADGIDLRSPQETLSMIRRAQAGLPIVDSSGNPVNTLWWMRQADSLEVVVGDVVRKMEQKYIYTPDANGVTYAAKYGEDGAQKIRAQIAQAVQPFRDMQTAIRDKDIGLATQIPRMNKAIIDDATNAQIMSNHPIARYLLGLKLADVAGAKELAAKLTSDMMTKVEGSPIVVESWLNSVGLEALTNHMPGRAIPTPAPAPGSATVPGAPSPAGGGGRRSEIPPPPTTFAGAVDEAQKAGEREPAFKDPKVYTSLVDVVNYIKDPVNTDDGKRGFLTYAFSASASGDYRVLQKFETDRYEKGVRIPGRFSTFETFTSPDIAKEAKRLGNDKWNFNKIVDWTEANFSGPLVGNELKKLEEVKNPRISFAWDPKERILSPVVDPAILKMLEPAPFREVGEGPPQVTGLTRRTIRQELQREIANIQPTINNLNIAFKGLGNVYDVAGYSENYEKRVVGMLAASGIRSGGVGFDVLKSMIEGKVGPGLPTAPQGPELIAPPAPPPTPVAPGKGARLDIGSGVGFPLTGREVAYRGGEFGPSDAITYGGPARRGRYATTNLSDERLLGMEVVGE